MNTLEKSRARRDRAEGVARGKMPRYGKNGSARSRWKIIPMTLGFLIILIGLCIAAVHIPALLYRDEQASGQTAYTIRPDETGVRNLLEYVRDHPGDDFDSDGLINSEETAYGTDPRNPDSDGDGVSDYAEIYLYNTRPVEKDSQLESVMAERLDALGIRYSDPWKVHDVVLWADDLSSRSRGTLIPTLRGYRFTSFSGWTQFPGTVYAYRMQDGCHIPLEYREAENAWRVDAADQDVEVILYAEKLPAARLLTAFGSRYFMEDGTVAAVLDLVLPEAHSFLTCREIVLQDLEDLEISATVTGTEMPDTDRTDLSRFGECTNEFSSLTDVYSSVLSGRPVPVSLQSPSGGEVLCLVYGFTEYGDLLIADSAGKTTDASGNPWMLEIIERAAITIDQNGEIRQREYFDFEGLGFSSTRGDKIHFLPPE